MRNRADVYAEVDAERDRQAKKWGCLHAWGVGDCSSASVHNSTKVMVLAEECGEAARAVLDTDIDQLRTELIQVAAVAVAWLEAL